MLSSVDRRKGCAMYNVCVYLPDTCGELLRQTVINLFVDLATKRIVGRKLKGVVVAWGAVGEK